MFGRAPLEVYEVVIQINFLIIGYIVQIFMEVDKNIFIQNF